MRPSKIPAPADVLNEARRRLGPDPLWAASAARALLGDRAEGWGAGEDAPGAAEARLILGSALRRLGDLDEARVVLGALAAARPDAWGAQYEAGAAFAAAGEAEAAASFLRRATALNPRSGLAWSLLGDQLSLAGDEAGADRARAVRVPGGPHDEGVRAAVRALLGGRREEGEGWLRARCGLEANDVSAVTLLAEAALLEGLAEAAEVFTALWLRRFPKFAALRLRHGVALLRLQAPAAALKEAEQLLEAAPLAYGPLALAAAARTVLGLHAGALEAFDRLAARCPDRAEVWLGRGHVLKTIGRRGDAEVSYRRALSLRPGFGEGYWSLANLKVAPFEASEVEAMGALVAAPQTPPGDRVPLHFALGKALEDAGRDAAAFAHYAQGAALHRAAHPYDADAHRAFMRQNQETFTARFFAERAGAGDLSEAPIFVLGLPRSGSTLVEQILASHPHVEGLSELPELARLAKEAARAGGGVYPAALARLDLEALRGFGGAYLEGADAYRRLGRPRFVDKHPGNVLHLGFLHLILPRARIIDVRRHPMACGFSLFKQHFAEGQAYSYDLEDVGRWYADYVAWTAHLERVLPGRVLRLSYEALVADPESQIRALLDHCGLPFDPACLAFHETQRPVRTPSALQVRRPINQEGLEHWRRFEAWLGPLRRGLSSAP